MKMLVLSVIGSLINEKVVSVLQTPSQNFMMIKILDTTRKIVHHNFDVWRHIMVMSTEQNSLICNSFLQEYNGSVLLAVDAHDPLPKQVIVFTRAVDDFLRALRELEPNLKGNGMVDFTSLFLIVITSEPRNISKMSAAMWRMQATNVVIVSPAPEDQVALHTYFPYRRGAPCGDSTPVSIASASAAKGWRDLYPNKLKSLYGCPLLISRAKAVRTEKIPIEVVKDELIGLLRQAMHFTPVEMFAEPESVAGVGANWTGSLGDVLDGRANLSLSSVPLGAELARVLDLSGHYYYINLSWVAPAVRVAPAWGRLLAPLGDTLWGALLVTVGLVFGFSEATKIPRVRRFCRRYFRRAERAEGFAFRMWGAMLGQPVRVRPRRFRDAYAVSLWIWFAFTVRSAYQSSLIGALKSETPFGNFGELADAVAAGYRYGGKRDVAAHFEREPDVLASWVEVPDAQFDALFARIARGDERFVTPATLEYVWRACAGRGWGRGGHGVAGCVHVLPEPILRFPLVMFLRLRSPLTRAADAWLARVRESGLLPPPPAAATATPSLPAPLPADPQPLTLQQVAGCFFCLLLGSFCTILVFLIELIVHNRQRASQQP